MKKTRKTDVPIWRFAESTYVFVSTTPALQGILAALSSRGSGGSQHKDFKNNEIHDAICSMMEKRLDLLNCEWKALSFLTEQNFRGSVEDKNSPNNLIFGAKYKEEIDELTHWLYSDLVHQHKMLNIEIPEALIRLGAQIKQLKVSKREDNRPRKTNRKNK